jgi:hypothetical protein
MKTNRYYYRLTGNKEFIFYLEDELLKDYDTEQKELIYYIYNRHVFSVEYERVHNLLEISSKRLNRIFKGKPYRARLNKLLEDRVLETDDRYIVDKKCKSYKINDEIFGKIAENMDYSKKVLYSTATKRRISKPSTSKTVLKDESGRAHSPVILDAIAAMKGYINYQSLLAFESDIRLFITNEYENRYSMPGYYDRLTDLLKQIWSAKYFLSSRNFNEMDGSYDLLFKVSSNGRIFGNFQNSSRKLKKVLLGVYKNYDISSSHPSILLGLLKEHNLPHDNFEDFVNDSEMKTKLTMVAGLENEVIDFKKAFLPLLYGGSISTYSESSFKKAIWRHMTFDIFDGDRSDEYDIFIKRMVKSVNSVLKPFKTEVKGWISFLRDVYIPANTKTSQGEPYILNCLGRRIYLNQCKYKNGNVIPRNSNGSLKNEVLHKVSSHIINGIESSFIYDITKITTELDSNTVIHNDFDGIVCTGIISDESKQLAAEKNGYIAASSFVEKDIDPEFEEFMKEGRDKIDK